MRHSVLEANRHKLQEEESENNRKKSEKAERAQAEAHERRKRALTAKSTGPPQLRAARELARRQAVRVERIRQAEREELRERLERDTSPERLCTTLTGSISIQGPFSRPTT